MSKKLTKVFGIDLGTTYSCIAYVDEHGKPVVVPNAESERITPSVVFFDEGNNIVVGKVAKENSKIYPNDVVSFVKRDMGNPNFLFEHNGKSYHPEEVSAYILRKLVGDAEQSLGEKITDVVITCPAYFGINEREATRLAGEIEGLNVRQVLNEPTAAAIAYGMTEQSENKVVLVYDLGGGTFDVTMIDISPESIQVICTGGDHNLGGKDWDDTVVRYLVEQFQEQTGRDEDILEDPDTCQELLLSAERAKQTLSQREKAPVSVAYGGDKAKVELTREKFEELTRDLIEKTVSLTQEMLGEARKKGYDKFDEILLVGGSTRMPQVAARIAKEFSIEAKPFDPNEAVAKGAALYGWKLSVNDELVKRIAEMTGKDIDDSEDLSLEEISEDIVNNAAQEVADDIGFTLAAVKKSGVKIVNVSSKSFGVVAKERETGQERVCNLILKNTNVPADVTGKFGTDEANQDTVEVRIMENEASDASIEPELAIEIGKAMLDLPPGLPADSPIDITFKLNEEGRLEVTAVEATQLRKVEVTIETQCVIQGEELKRAKAHSKSVVVS